MILPRRALPRAHPVPAAVAGIVGVLSVLLGAGAASVLGAGGDSPWTLAGARILQADGSLLEGGALVIAGGRIERFAKEEEKELPSPIRLPAGSVISPGLIEVASGIGAAGENAEAASPIDAGASAEAAIDPYHRDLRRALEAGVTAALVCPHPANPVAGAAVTFRTAPLDGRLDVLRRDGPLVFAIGESALQRNRRPTSRGGLIQELRQVLDEARRGGVHPRLGLFLEGRLPGLAFCDRAQDVRAAMEIFGAAGRVPAIAFEFSGHRDETRSIAESAAKLGVPLVLGPFDFSSSERQLAAAGEIARAGARVVLSGGRPEFWRRSLRVTAALAARAGLDAAAARRAMTLAPAELAGVAERVGSIEAGKDADLAIFSDDPLRLDARVIAVYVRGARHFQAEEEAETEP
jgi:imidazolonepropionase-like amidohydrolase